MFEKHPKELLPAILVNMFAHFAFFTLMFSFLFFLSAKFDFITDKTGIIYSIFYVSISILMLIGGLIADKTRDYKGTISKGLILMTIGCLVIAIPSGQSWVFLTIICIALFLIAFGSALFKVNIYAMLGQMYDNPNYSHMRDSGFLLSNLFVNIGALLAPLATIGIRNYWMLYNGLTYNSEFLNLCFRYIANDENKNSYYFFENLAAASGQGTMEMSEFVTQYLHVYNAGFSCIFALAVIAMVISLIIFLLNEIGRASCRERV